MVEETLWTDSGEFCRDSVELQMDSKRAWGVLSMGLCRLGEVKEKQGW